MADVEHQKVMDDRSDEAPVVKDVDEKHHDFLSSSAVDEEALANSHGRFLRWCYTLGVEARGVERVPENERSTKHSWAIFLFWVSVNTVLTTLPIGTLVSVFGLTYKQGVACIVGFGALAAIPTAFVATLGPMSGMRTMVITRYSYGVFGTPLIIVLNVVTQLGFEVIALIVGGQALAAVNSNLPLVVGIVVIGVITVAICIFGYSLILRYEKVSFAVAGLIFIFLYALGATAPGGYDVTSGEGPDQLEGVDLSGAVLSMSSVMFGSYLGWSAVAADYNVRLPADYSKSRLFWSQWLGMTLAISFGSILGATLLTITDDAYTSAYEDLGIGGLVHQTFLGAWGTGAAGFFTVLAALTVIANGIPNTYSSALGAQALHPVFQRVPRVLWVILAFVAYTAAAIGGRDNFEDWNACFLSVLIEEHFVCRSSFFGRSPLIAGGYDFSVYSDTKRLPLGLAALFAFACGVAGFVTYYVGPLAAKIGTYGGDIGFFLAWGFCGIAYIPARLLELHLVGR